MIEEVVRAREAGGLPFGIGTGANAYIYVDNCAQAHVDCLETMLHRPHRGERLFARIDAHPTPNLALSPKPCTHNSACVDAFSLSFFLLSLLLSFFISLFFLFLLALSFSFSLYHPLVAGHAFHLTDYVAPLVEHMEPFFEAVGLHRPTLSVPVAAALPLAYFNEVCHGVL